jgi:cation:H+ antiporter
LQILGWLMLAVSGFWVALVASRGVAAHANSLVQATRLSPFVVGMVVLAIGTDVPEIVNSIVTSAAGHGDLNVGDSIGSTLTQMTLVLGILPFLTRTMEIQRRAVVAIGGLTALAVLVGVVLVGDGGLGRMDGLILVVGWLVAIWAINRADVWWSPALPEAPHGRRIMHGLATFGFLLIVALGSVASVAAMIEIAEILAVPEYIISFFGASIGTSMPELIVDITAIRSGAMALAVGDILGSSLVDATLSIGIGPSFFPTPIDAEAAVIGGLYTAVAVGMVTVLLSTTRRHGRLTGTALIAIYLLSYVVILR